MLVLWGSLWYIYFCIFCFSQALPQAPFICIPLIFRVPINFSPTYFYILIRIREGDILPCVFLQHIAYTSILLFFLFYIVLELIMCWSSLLFSCQTLEGREHISNLCVLENLKFYYGSEEVTQFVLLFWLITVPIKNKNLRSGNHLSI